VTNRGTKIVALIILYKERERERKKEVANNLETKINTSNINIYIRTLISYFFFFFPLHLLIWPISLLLNANLSQLKVNIGN